MHLLVVIVFLFQLLLTSPMDFVCGMIGSTNVHALNTDWSCTTAGVSTTNPCYPAWTGVTCSGGNIVAIQVTAGGKLSGKPNWDHFEGSIN